MSFWANAINGVQEAPPAPVQRGLYTYNSPIPQNYQYQSPQQAYIPSVRMTEGSICPGCGSDKYPKAEKVMNGFKQGVCAECGYHPSFQQSGYGVPSLKSNPGEATPARQVRGGQTMQQSIALLNAGGGEHL